MTTTIFTSNFQNFNLPFSQDVPRYSGGQKQVPLLQIPPCSQSGTQKSKNNNNGGGIQMTNVLPFVWNKMIDKNVHQH